MPHILFVATKNGQENIRGVSEWDRFADIARRIQPTLEPENTLAETVWLLDISKNLAALAELMETAKRMGIPFKTLFLESQPMSIK